MSDPRDNKPPDEVDRAISELSAGDDILDPALTIKVSMPYLNPGETDDAEETISYFVKMRNPSGGKIKRVEGWMLEVTKHALLGLHMFEERLQMMLTLQAVNDDRDRRKSRRKVEHAPDVAMLAATKITKES